MKILNSMRLRVPSKSSNESFVRVAVAAFAAQLDPTCEEISEIKTAVSEAVTNCIVHGYRDKIGEIYIFARITADRKLTVRITDKGCGIENIEKAMEPLYTTAPGGERSGLGFTVMESFMDRLRVTSKPGAGTTVTMEKKLAGRDAE